MKALPLRSSWIVLFVILATGLALRLHHIDNRGFWQDEVDLRQGAIDGHMSSAAAPLPALIHAAVMGTLRSTGPVAMRLPAVFFGTLAILMVFLLVRLRADEMTALLAAAFVALSPLSLMWSQEARPYGLLQFLALLSLYLVLKSEDEGRWPRYVVAYGVAMSLFALTHLLALQLAVVVMVHQALRWWRADRTRRPLILFVVTILCVAASLAWLLNRPAHRISATVADGPFPDGARAFVSRCIQVLGPVGPILLPGGWGSFVGPLFVVLALIGTIIGQGMHGSARRLLFLSAVLPLIATFLTIGHKGSWPSWERYILMSAAPWLMLAAAGVRTLTARLPRPAGAAVIALALAAFVPGVRAWMERRPDPHQTTPARVTKAIQKIEGQLTGVLVPHVSYVPPDRAVWIYDSERRSPLPTYVATGDSIIPTAIVTGRFGLKTTRLIWNRARLPAGNYALFIYEPTRSFSCGEINVLSQGQNEAMLNRALSTPKVPVCEVWEN